MENTTNGGSISWFCDFGYALFFLPCWWLLLWLLRSVDWRWFAFSRLQDHVSVVLTSSQIDWDFGWPFLPSECRISHISRWTRARAPNSPWSMAWMTMKRCFARRWQKTPRLLSWKRCPLTSRGHPHQLLMGCWSQALKQMGRARRARGNSQPPTSQTLCRGNLSSFSLA